MTAHTARPGLVGRILSKGVFDLSVWVVALVSWSYLLVKTDWNLPAISAWSVPFLLMISLVTLPWRSVTWMTIVGFFMLGFGPVFALSALAGQWLSSGSIGDFLGDLAINVDITNVGEDFVAPVVEELLKVLPLLALFWWRRLGWRDTTGPLDYAVLAGATGAGLAFAEDTFVYLAQGLDGPTSDVYALGLGPIYGGLVGSSDPGFSLFGQSTFADVGSFLYPEMQDLFGAIWSGHGALALGIGLALGLGVWLKRQTGSGWWIALPFIVYLWAVWEHVMANWYGGAGCSAGGKILCTVAAIDLHGRIFPVVILAAFVYAAYTSGRVLRSHRLSDVSLLLSWKRVNRDSYRSRGWSGAVALLDDRLDFLRWRRRTGYGAFHLEHSRRVRHGQVLGVMASRIQTLRYRQALEGQAATTIPEPTVTAIDAATPIA
jgi:hypothetical protein